MKKWKGRMKAENFSAEVVVFHEEASELEREIWYGHGLTKTLFIGGRYHKTSIGDIIVGSNSTDAKGLDFDFAGIGKLILI